MVEPRHTPLNLPPDDLERALSDLGSQLDWPAERDLTASIATRIANSEPKRSWLPGLLTTAGRPRLVWSTAALLILATAIVLALLPSTRSTVADRLGIPGISISINPTATIVPGKALQIGERSTIEQASRAFRSDLLLPPTAILGPPDEVYLLDRGGIVQVTYIYTPTTDLPEVGDTGVSVLISQFDGSTNDSFIRKQLGADTTIELVEVNHQRAFWLSGSPHIFYYERPNGMIDEETMRLAANVLLWEMNGTTIRIETMLDRDAAIQIAKAIRPAS